MDCVKLKTICRMQLHATLRKAIEKERREQVNQMESFIIQIMSFSKQYDYRQEQSHMGLEAEVLLFTSDKQSNDDVGN